VLLLKAGASSCPPPIGPSPANASPAPGLAVAGSATTGAGADAGVGAFGTLEAFDWLLSFKFMFSIPPKTSPLGAAWVDEAGTSVVDITGDGSLP